MIMSRTVDFCHWRISLVWKNGRKSSVTSDVFSSMFGLVGLMFGLVKFSSTDYSD